MACNFDPYFSVDDDASAQIVTAIVVEVLNSANVVASEGIPNTRQKPASEGAWRTALQLVTKGAPRTSQWSDFCGRIHGFSEENPHHGVLRRKLKS